MPEEKVESNVSTVGKPNAGDPVLTSEIKDRSDARMAKLAGNFIANAPRVQKEIGKSTDANLNDGSQSNAAQPEKLDKKDGENQPLVKPVVDAPVKKEEPPKADELPKATEKKPEGEQKEKGTPPAQKKLSYDELEVERKKHQSRADTVEAEAKTLREAKIAWETERASLLESKKQVDEFTKDPVSFINERLPELGKKLAIAGDPIKMIEAEVGEFHAKLEKSFKDEFGDDWSYSETESLKPGTPSFRFRLAIQSKTDEARQHQVSYVEGQRKRQVEAQQRAVADKKRLTEEYGLTEEHFKKADEVFKKEGITFYNLVRLALLDDIIQMAVNKVVHPAVPDKDLSVTRGAIAEGDLENKPKLSDKGRQMAARLPIHRTAL